MRGEFCVAFASFSTFAAAVIMVFVHIGQLNPSSIPRTLMMIKVDVADFGSQLQQANNGASITGLYANSSVSILGNRDGLADQYRWGLMNYCGTNNGGSGRCDGVKFGGGFRPWDVVVADVPQQFSAAVDAAVPRGSTFRRTNFTCKMTKGAFWSIFIGSCCSLLAFIFGVIPHRVMFGLASLWAIIATLGLAIGAALWTATFVKVRDSAVNGISVGLGNGIILTWVAFALCALSIGPSIICSISYVRL